MCHLSGCLFLLHPEPMDVDGRVLAWMEEKSAMRFSTHINAINGRVMAWIEVNRHCNKLYPLSRK